MKQLNEIIFTAYSDEDLPQESEFFIVKMLQNSQETLQNLFTPKLVISDVIFPKLKQLELKSGGKFILLHEFRTRFPKILKNMKNIQTVTLNLIKPECISVCDYILAN